MSGNTSGTDLIAQSWTVEATGTCSSVAFAAVKLQPFDYRGQRLAHGDRAQTVDASRAAGVTTRSYSFKLCRSCASFG
jgi:hypothetical protein